MVVAQSPIVVRGLLLPCTAYAANCPCGERLIVAPSPVAILGKGFVIVLFGKRLVVDLLNRCGLLGIFAMPALGNVHTFGNVHAIFSVLTVFNLGILAPLVIAWRGKVIVASCEQQHEILIVA
jgi:hypothetical protein